MQILSNSTRKYLAPLDTSRLCGSEGRPAIMRLSLPDKNEEDPEAEVKSFIVEVFDRQSSADDAGPGSVAGNVVASGPLTHETSCWSGLANNFVPSRFKHGYQRRSRNSIFHERYEVPATDYSLYLFLHTWTGEREVTPAAQALLTEMIAHEDLYAKCAQRAAIYKAKLDELLPAYNVAKAKYDEYQLIVGDLEDAQKLADLFYAQSRAALATYHAIAITGIEDGPDANIEERKIAAQRYRSLLSKTVEQCHEISRLSTKINAIAGAASGRPVPPLLPEDAMRLDAQFIASLDLHPILAKKGTINPSAPDLTVYQSVCATNAISVPGYAFYCEPGCGKTAPGIATIDYVTALTYATMKRPARILILGPKNIRRNWLTEIHRFSRFNLKTTILQGANESVRSYALIGALVGAEKGHVVIAGYETASNTDMLLNIEWDLVIIDESHSISNMGTKRAKFCLKLRNCAAKRIIMTGTPVRNTPFDLYAQLEFIGRGCSGFSSFNAFKNFFGVWKNIPGKGFRVLEELQNIPMLQERLAKYTFLLRKDEAMPNMPLKVRDTLECTLSPDQNRIYRQIASQLQAEINDLPSGMVDAMTVRSHLTKLLRLAEITSGYAKTDESGVYRFDPNPKMEMIVEEIKDYLAVNPKSKIQIWAYFHENIKQLFARLNNIEGIPSVVFYGGTRDADRIEAERRFNCDPRTRVFIGNPASGGQGLNLLGFNPANPQEFDTNCDWVIYYSQDWSSVTRRQSEDRAYRKGTRVQVRITDLIVPGSIDSMIIDRVQGKIEMAADLQEIRNILSQCLDPAVNGD